MDHATRSGGRTGITEPVAEDTPHGETASVDLSDAALFLVEWSDGIRARCALVSPSGTEAPEGWSGSDSGGAVFWDEDFFLDVPAGGGWSGGELVACIGYCCRLDEDGDMTVVPDRHVVLGTYGHRTEAARAVPPVQGLSDPSVMERRRIEAIAETQDDEALALWYETGDGLACHVLAASGAAFLRAEVPEDHFDGDDVGPGLWLLADARDWRLVSADGERERGVDGGWRPATPADLERFGLEEDAVDTLVEEISGRCGHTAARAMEEASSHRP